MYDEWLRRNQIGLFGILSQKGDREEEEENKEKKKEEEEKEEEDEEGEEETLHFFVWLW